MPSKRICVDFLKGTQLYYLILNIDYFESLFFEAPRHVTKPVTWVYIVFGAIIIHHTYIDMVSLRISKNIYVQRRENLRVLVCERWCVCQIIYQKTVLSKIVI